MGKGNEPSFSPTCPISIISLHLGNWRMKYNCQLNHRIYALDMFRQNLIYHVLMWSTLLLLFFHCTVRMLWIPLFIWIQRKGVLVNIYIRKELWTALDFKPRTMLFELLQGKDEQVTFWAVRMQEITIGWGCGK